MKYIKFVLFAVVLLQAAFICQPLQAHEDDNNQTILKCKDCED